MGFRHISVTLIFGTHCPHPRHFFPIIAQHFEFVNPTNNIQNGFFTPVSHFFRKIRKLTVFSRNPHTPIIPQSVRLRMDADRSFVPKNRLSCHFPAVRAARAAHSNASKTKRAEPAFPSANVCKASKGLLTRAILCPFP